MFIYSELEMLPEESILEDPDPEAKKLSKRDIAYKHKEVIIPANTIH